MTAADLVICGARAVLPAGIAEVDIAVKDGRILALTCGEARPSAGEELDARGMLALPGVIDTHTHHREPGFTYKEDITSATRAAAAGGVTTSIGMPNVDPPTTTVERYRAVLDLYARKAVVDYNHNPAPTALGEVPGLAAAGALGFKLYMISDTKRSYPHIPGIGVHHHGHLLDIAEAVAATGRPLMVHPHDQELQDTVEGRFWARGETDHLAYARAYGAYDSMVWDSAVAYLVRLQEATGVRMHVLHVKTPKCAELVRQAKARGAKITAEMNPVAVFLCNSWSNIERLGPYALSTWVHDEFTSDLWRALVDGTIDVIGTDHAPHTREDKEIGWTDMWQAAGGVPQIQEYLSLFLTAVAEGKLTIERLVEVVSSAPARTFGLYPRKGALLPGSDADIVIVDPARERVITAAEVESKCGWTPFEGVRVRGVVRETIVRGRFVYRSDKVVGEPGWGRLAAPVTDIDGGHR